MKIKKKIIPLLPDICKTAKIELIDAEKKIFSIHGKEPGNLDYTHDIDLHQKYQKTIHSKKLLKIWI